MKQTRMSRRLAALACTAALALSLLPAAGAAELQPAVSDNINKEDYTTWSRPVTSYLYENPSGGLTRVEYTGGEIVVEDYDSSFQIQASRSVPMELTLWGGFYAGAEYNFLIFGQENPGENDSTEVIRVVKYDKDWNRMGQASLRGANTTVPFDAGSLRCDEYGGYLYIRTCHTMYTYTDGLNHQANLMMAVDQSSMEITDAFYDIWNTDYGYVSHSFNQFVIVDQAGHIVSLDHGDANPRAMTFMSYYADAGSGKFSGQTYGTWCSVGKQRTFAGASGNNTTGASVGGLAETSQCYMMAYNYDGAGGSGPRNVYLQAMDIASGRGKDYQITRSGGSTTPVLAPTGLDGGYLLWNEKDGSAVTDTLYYLHYGADGVPEKLVSTTGALSDCAPICYNGQVVWYVTDNSAPVFYTLDAGGVTAHPTADGTDQPEVTPAPTLTPTPVPTAGTENPLPAGDGNHTVDNNMAVLEDGTLVIWGQAHEDGEDWNEQLATIGSGFTAVSQFDVDYLGLKADGTLWGWGHGKGALFEDEPAQIMDHVKQISGFLALKEDGTVWDVWKTGANAYVTGGASQISHNGDLGIILKNDGTVYSYDMFSDNPLVQGALEGVRYVSGQMAILDNGELWYWGSDNSFGISGTGTGEQPLSGPAKVLDNVVNVWGENGSGLNPSVFALTADGSLYSWGLNQQGQLGYQGGNQEYLLNPFVYGENAGSFPYQDCPRQVDISNVADVANVGYTTFFLKNDGSLWVVGYNIYSNALLPAEVEKVDTFTQVLSGVMLPGSAAADAPDPEPTPEPTPEPEPGADSFNDVPADAWYAPYAGTAAGAGLMQGTGNGRFSPAQTLSVAEVVTLAARLYAEDTGETVPAASGAWYTGAYEYCLDNGLFTAAEVPLGAMERPATRFEMVDLLDRAVPDSEKAAIHQNITVPDLAEAARYGDVVYRWYRAGITQGDQNGRFNGDSQITRAETAAILCRLAGLTERV